MQNPNLKATIVFLFVFFCLLPVLASAYTYQDVQNFLNNNPAPSGCVNWAEEVTSEAGSGYEVWRRCAQDTLYTVARYWLNGTHYTNSNARVLLCDGYASYGWRTDFYQYFTMQRQIWTYCNGNQVYEDWAIDPNNNGVNDPCLIQRYQYPNVNCNSYDTLLVEFIPVDQCTSAFGYTSTSCATNCTDPVDKTNATEICGDGIDNDCNGQIDECTSTRDTGEPDCESNQKNPATPPMTKPANSSANLSSGNLYHSQTLFQAQGPILPAGFAISYNSLDTSSTPLGRGWTHNYQLSIVPNNSNGLVLKKGDGSFLYFWLNNSVYTAKAGSRDFSTIVKNADSTYTQTMRDGTVYEYNASGKLTRIKDRYNNAINLTYTGDDLSAIQDPSGRTITLSYDTTATPHRIMTVTDPEGNLYEFVYDSAGMLWKLINPAAETNAPQGSWEYLYDAGGYMKSKKDPNGNTS